MAADINNPGTGNILGKADRMKVVEAQRKEQLMELKQQQLDNAHKLALDQAAAGVRTPHGTLIPYTTPTPIGIIKPTASLSIEELQQELYKRKLELNKKVDDMILDADAYRVNIPSIKLLTEDKTEAERLKYIGNIAVTTSVPIIIVATYIGEIYGFTEELDKKIKGLMDFYTIKEVLNVKRGT